MSLTLALTMAMPGLLARCMGSSATIPGAPENLGIVTGSTTATLTWDMAPNGGSPLTGHQYRLSTDGGATYGAWIDIPTSDEAGDNADGYTVTGLTNGTAYTIEVRAMNDVGEGPESNSVTGTPEATAPAAPEDLSIFTMDAQANLSWTVGDDGGAPLLRHQYRLSTDGGVTWGLWVDIPNSGGGHANAGTFTVDGLANGTRYTVQVRAVNGVDPGPESNTASGTPLELLAAFTVTRGGNDNEWYRENVTGAAAGDRQLDPELTINRIRRQTADGITFNRAGTLRFMDWRNDNDDFRIRIVTPDGVVTTLTNANVGDSGGGFMRLVVPGGAPPSFDATENGDEIRFLFDLGG